MGFKPLVSANTGMFRVIEVIRLVYMVRVAWVIRAVEVVRVVEVILVPGSLSLYLDPGALGLVPRS